MRHRLQLLGDDVEPELEVRRVDVGDQPPGEARQNPALDPLKVLRAAIGGDHQALPRRDDLVHRVEELLLRGILAGDELDVVDHQQIGRAQPLLEAVGVLGAHRGDELEHELLGGHIDHRATAAPAEVLPDRVHQVRLAEPGLAVEEQRVERHRAALRDAARGIVGDLVGLTDDEAVEGVARVERDRGAVLRDRLRINRYDRLGRRLGTGIEQGQRRALARGDHRDAADRGEVHAPGVIQALAIMGLDPARHERGRQRERERPRLVVEAGERRRLEPVVERARAKVSTQAGSDRAPGDRHGIGTGRIREPLSCASLVHTALPCRESRFAASMTTISCADDAPLRGRPASFSL